MGDAVPIDVLAPSSANTSSDIVARFGRRQSINNTGVPEGEANGEPCSLNFPCEKDDSGEITFTEGSSYGQQLDQIYGCLGDNFEFDLTLEGCDLEKP